MTSATARAKTTSRLELHPRRRGGVGRGLEERLRPEAVHVGHDAAGEQPQSRVVLANGLVEAASLDGDPVFGAFELGLESQEILVRLQLRIALDGDHQAA